jgi:signal peptidase I
MVPTKRKRMWMLVLGAASVIYAAGNLFQPTVVVGESMSPTLHDGRMIWVDRTYYRTHQPRCGEVIVFRQSGETYVKRIYRAQGEKVQYISAGGQFLMPVREPFYEVLRQKYAKRPGALQVDELLVPDGEVFVLGDNYSASIDSRQLGPIPISSIIGRAHLVSDPQQALQHEFVPMPSKRHTRQKQAKVAVQKPLVLSSR